MLAIAFNKFLSEQMIPQQAAEWLQTVVDSKWQFIILCNLFLLALGCVMEIISAILIVAPLLAPIAVQYGMDPIHFGIMFIVNLELGYLTPPMGVNLFVSSTVFNRNIVQVIKATVPFLLMMLFCLGDRMVRGALALPLALRRFMTSFIQSRDGTRIRIGKSGDGARHVLLVHGLAEHMGRYGHVVEALTGAGFAVTAVELRGHGESEGKRGHVDRWEQYLDDVRAAAETIDGPVVLLGHSMGGLVALDLAIDGLSNGIDALVLSDPNVAVGLKPPQSRSWAPGALTTPPRLSLANELDATSSVGTSPWSTSTRDSLVYSTITPMVHRDVVVARARCRERDTLRDAAADAARRRGRHLRLEGVCSTGAQLGRRSLHHYLSRVVPRDLQRGRGASHPRHADVAEERRMKERLIEILKERSVRN